MKRILFLYIALVGILMGGCTKHTENVNATTQDTTTQATTTQATTAETTTQTTTVPQPTKTNLLSTMSKDERKALHTFLSNFSEVEFYNFDVSNYNFLDLIDFAIGHTVANDTIGLSSYDKNADLKYSDYYGIPVSDINKILDRYFGVTVNNHNQYIDRHAQMYSMEPSVFYENNHYYIGYSDYHCLSVSQATAMYDNGDGTYAVEFDVYSGLDIGTENYVDITDWGLTADEIATLRANKQKEPLDDYQISYVYSGTAIIKPHTYNGKNTYQLIKITRLK